MRPRADNPLPVWKMGRYLRFSWEQVSTWLQAQAGQLEAVDKGAEIVKARPTT